MKTSEIRDMTSEERTAKVEDLRKELLEIRVRSKAGNVANPLKARQIRRDIARLLTVENQVKMPDRGK
ncbi:MAG TPA: 50S ribosomal protein L29 [Alphaproteobacteria bacterium]|nr:50S ribosomal protein L29 [Alphaproteobacteria bacterium]